MSIYDKASLVLIPSGTKTSKVYSQKPVNGDGDFTFSRSTAATRVNADGNIEKETQNLLLQSNNFDTTWTLNNGSLTSGQSGYDGSNNAWLLTSATSVRLQQGITLDAVQTFSIYAKAGTQSAFQFEFYGADYAIVQFNLSTGVPSISATYIDASMEDVGGGWYRCIMVINGDYPIRRIGNFGAGNIYIQDAQLEQGLVARDYIETTTAAVEGGITDNVPRLDYTDSSCPALLLEPQRTNILPASEYLLDEWAFVGGVSATTNNSISPEGVQNATSLSWGGGSYMYYLAGDYNGQTLTFSFWAKGTAGETIVSRGNTSVGGSQYKTHTFDGTWQRFTHTINGGTYNYVYPLDNRETMSALSMEIYGLQLEAGSYATSYIPTYGTSVTRNAENGIISSAADVIGQTQGTLFLDFVYNGKSNTTADNFNLTLGTWASNIITIGQYNAALYARIYASSVLNFNQDFGAMTIGQRYKCAIAYASNDAVFYVNGVLQGSDTSVVVPAISNVSLNRGAFENSKRINQSLLFKTRLSNEELAALTTI